MIELKYRNYIHDLSKIQKLLEEHDCAKQQSQPYFEATKHLVNAGLISCLSLRNLLKEDTFWGALAAKGQGQSEPLNVIVPATVELLKHLGYRDNPESILQEAWKSLRVDGSDSQKTPKSIIQKLQTDVCALAAEVAAESGIPFGETPSRLPISGGVSNPLSELREKLRKKIIAIGGVLTFVATVGTFGFAIKSEMNKTSMGAEQSQPREDQKKTEQQRKSLEFFQQYVRRIDDSPETKDT